MGWSHGDLSPDAVSTRGRVPARVPERSDRCAMGAGGAVAARADGGGAGPTAARGPARNVQRLAVHQIDRLPLALSAPRFPAALDGALLLPPVDGGWHAGSRAGPVART